MGISKKKRLYIKRNYPKRSAEVLADETGLAVSAVKAVLGISHQEKNARICQKWDMILQWVLLCAVFLAPFIILPGIRDGANLSQNAFVQVASLLLAVFWLLRSLKKGQLMLWSSPLLWPLVGLTMWVLVSIFWSFNPFEASRIFFQMLTMGIFFWIVMAFHAENPFFDKVIIALVMAGGGIAIIGICQHLFGFSIIPQARPPAATFANRNMAAQFMVAVIPFGVYLLATGRSTAMTWSAAVVTGLMLVYVVYIRSLAGWVAVAAGLAVCVIAAGYCLRKKGVILTIQGRLLPVVTMVLIILFMINIGPEGFELRFGGVSDEIKNIRTFVDTPGGSPGADGMDTPQGQAVSTLQWRWSIWANTLAMIGDNPVFGVGAGNFRTVYPLYSQAVIKDQKFGIDSQALHAHNDYVQTGAELGGVGVIFIVWGIGGFVYVTFCLLGSQKRKKDVVLTSAILGAGIGILLNAGFSFPFQRAIPPFVAMLVSGVAAAMYIRQKKHCPRIVSSQRILQALVAGMACLCLYFVYFHYNTLQFDRYYGKAVQSYNQNQWPRVLENGKKALAYRAANTDLLFFYMGYAHDKMGDTGNSIQYYEKMLDRYPYYVNALINLGLAYGKSAMNEKAVDMYKKVTQILPDRFEYYNDIAHYSLESGDLEQAYDYFQKAWSLNRNHPSIPFNLGVVCMRLKKYDQARQLFQVSLQLRPGWEKPARLLKLIDTMQTK